MREEWHPAAQSRLSFYSRRTALNIADLAPRFSVRPPAETEMIYSQSHGETFSLLIIHGKSSVEVRGFRAPSNTSPIVPLLFAIEPFESK
jgi:hypothetical protein